MKRVKNIYLIDKAGSVDGFSDASKATGKTYATGLILEMHDGTYMAQLSTDMIQPFEEVKPTKTLAQLILDLNKAQSRE